MNKRELNALKARILEKKEKASDMDVVLSELLQLPPGQLKKLLSQQVLSIMEKYGYMPE